MPAKGKPYQNSFPGNFDASTCVSATMIPICASAILISLPKSVAIAQSLALPPPRLCMIQLPSLSLRHNPWCQVGLYGQRPRHSPQSLGLSVLIVLMGFQHSDLMQFDFSAKILIDGFDGFGTIILSLISENSRSRFMLELILLLCRF